MTEIKDCEAGAGRINPRRLANEICSHFWVSWRREGALTRWLVNGFLLLLLVSLVLNTSPVGVFETFAEWVTMRVRELSDGLSK